MPIDCSDVLAKIKTLAGWADGHIATSEIAAEQAFTEWEAMDDHAAIYYLHRAVSYTNLAVKLLIGKDDPAAGQYIFHYYLSNCVGGDYELTMDAMINVMLTATPDEVQYFIGLVDAYRQSIWTRPFNEQFFGALAQGFMEWP